MSKIKFYKDSAKTQQVYPELDPEDITKFESLEDIENAFPNVSGEDTNLTLNHTVEAPMKLELVPSELEQETTTGANIQKYSVRTSTYTGETYTCDEKGQVTIVGTNTDMVTYGYNIQSTLPMTLQPGTYTMKVVGTKDNNVTIGRSNGAVSLNSEQEYTFTIASEITNFNITISVNPGAHNSNFYITLASGTTATTERYTGGLPQPNPDFPSQIHSVSGDNEITVCGKNLADPNELYNQMKAISDTTTRTTVDGRNCIRFTSGNFHEKNIYLVQYKEKTQYTFRFLAKPESTIDKALFFFIVYTDDTKKSARISGSSNWDELRIVSDGNKTVKSFYFSYGTSVPWYLDEDSFNIIEGNQTTYEPYHGRTLPLNLPVENYNFTPYKDGTNKSTNGIIFNVNDAGEIIANNTATANAYFYCHTHDYEPYWNIPKGVYYLSGCPSGGSTSKYFLGLRLYNDTTSVVEFKDVGDGILIDTTSYTYNRIMLYIYITNGQSCNNLIFKPQLESGSKSNTFTPYGIAPLEYCKLGTYSDEFFKNDPNDPNYDSNLELDKWYLKKNVGKVSLEDYNYGVYDAFDGYKRRVTTEIPNIKYVSVNTELGSGMAERYLNHTGTGMSGVGAANCFAIDVSMFQVTIPTGTNPSGLFYYALATPQYILLSDTLQHQLEDIYNWVESYPGQTNISQINNDLPFIISAHAMKDLSVIDKYPTEDSEHLVESGGVYEVINDINGRIADIDTIRHNSKNVAYGTETSATIDLDDAYDTDLVRFELHKETTQETSILPDGYTQVNYIESSGTQYIDTNFKPTGNTSTIVDCEYTPTSGNTSAIFGTQNYASQQYVDAYNFGNITSNGFIYVTKYDKTAYNYGISDYYLGRKLYKMLKNNAYIGDTLINTFVYNDFTCTYNAFLFAHNYNGSVSGLATMKLYNCKIYDNDVLIREFIPCYRNSDNEVGLYDLVNDVFYTNQGTGAFTYGAVVSIPNPDYPMSVNVVEGYRNLLDINNFEQIALTSSKTRVGYLFNLDAGAYTISNLDFGNTGQSMLYISVKYEGESEFTEIGNTGSLNYFIITNKGQVALTIPIVALPSKVLDKGMLTKGAAILPYIPYGSNYVNLKSIKGKNLLDVSAFKGLILNEDGTVKTRNYYTTSTCRIVFKGKPNTTYYFSVMKADLTVPDSSYGISLAVNGSWKNWRHYPAIVTDANGEVILNIGADSYADIGLYNVYLQLEESARTNTYQPFEKTEALLPLNNNFLAEKGAYKDKYYIDESTGKHYIYKAWGKVVLDGTQGTYWSKTNRTNTTRFLIQNAITDDNGLNANTMSNYFISNANSYSQDIEGMFLANSHILYLSVNNDIATEINAFKTWLSTHNTEVYYQLATPQLIEVPATDITLFDGINHISNSENATMEITYVKDINIVINKLTNAVVSLGSNV